LKSVFACVAARTPAWNVSFRSLTAMNGIFAGALGLITTVMIGTFAACADCTGRTAAAGSSGA
jgi:hypothetical protein